MALVGRRPERAAQVTPSGLHRRGWGLLVGGPTACSADDRATSGARDYDSATEHGFEGLEKTHHSRLGLTAIDTATGRALDHRSEERFAFASTNKVFIAAHVLSKSFSSDLDMLVKYKR